MDVKDNQIYIHVTEVGGCIRKAILRAKGEPETNVYYHSQLGTATHRVCEEALQMVLNNQELNMGIAMERAYNKHYKDQDVFWDGAKPEIMEKVRKLEMWFVQEGENLRNIREVEKNVQLPLQEFINGMPVILTGTMDIMTGKEIIDIKSGKTRSKKHAWQVAAYSYMSPSADDIDLYPGRIVYLGGDFGEKVYKNGRVHRYHERVVSREDVLEYSNDFLQQLYDYIVSIRIYYPNVPEPKECSDCFFCPFHDGCYGHMTTREPDPYAYEG